MKALDTNVLVRLLTGDDPRQCQRAVSALKEAENQGKPLLVGTLVVLELIWVLQRSYRIPDKEILGRIKAMSESKALAMESPRLIARLIAEGINTRLDLADLLIGLQGQAAGCESTLTFDKRAGRSDLFEVI